MKDTGILFTPENVQKVLAGSKTQTRRIIKPQPASYIDSLIWFQGQCYGYHDGQRGSAIKCRYGTVGDRLWVREKFTKDPDGDIHYAADGDGKIDKWSPSIHMPKRLSRLSLELTEVRVERLNEISIPDAIAEGCRPGDMNDRYAAVEKFKLLWESNTMHRTGSWDLNPWVWVLCFKKVKP